MIERIERELRKALPERYQIIERLGHFTVYVGAQRMGKYEPIRLSVDPSAKWNDLRALGHALIAAADAGDEAIPHAAGEGES